MVFSSVPVYLDPPNWQQQPNQQVVVNENPHLPAFTASHHAGVAGGAAGSSTRPGSLADRARLAKLPQPEAALKCPRCESTNTKFCYYNNYNLSQPRHFCKTCRRYWTKGGALRNVPVGGGCRRNKKTKSQRNSKSPAPSERQVGSSSTSSTSAIASEMMGHLPQHPTHHQLPFMTPLHNLTQFGVGNFGLNFAGASGQADMVGFQIGNNSGMSNSIGVQQFPFIEPASTSSYPFQSHEAVEAMTSSSRVSQSAPVKMEENHGLNIPRPFLGMTENNQYWGGNSWTDLTGLNSSFTSHLL